MKRCVSVTGDVDVKPFREVRRGSLRQRSGGSQSRRRDGSPGAEAANRQTIACPRRRARPPRAAIGTTASIAHQASVLVYPGRERQGRATNPRRAAPPASAPATSTAAAGAGSTAAAHDHAQVDRRCARRMISQQSRTEQNPRCQSRAADRRSGPRTGRAEQPARSRTECARANATGRDRDGRTRPNASSNPADSSHAAVAEPSADQPQAAAEPRQCSRPAAACDGMTLAAADASTAKPTASLQMLLLVMAAALALAGITVSLVFRFGRIAARGAPCDVKRRGCGIQSRTSGRSPQPRSAPPTFRTRTSGAARSAQPTLHRGGTHARPRRAASARPAAHAARRPDEPERQVTEMLARLARSAQT